MQQDAQAATPALQPAFDMVIEHGPPVSVGAIATGGERCLLPVLSGTFRGEGLAGTIVAGGQTLLARADGVTMIEASYYIRFAGGEIARCFGTGYREAERTRLSLLFEAAEGSSVAALATRAFIAEQADGSASFSISRII